MFLRVHGIGEKSHCFCQVCKALCNFPNFPYQPQPCPHTTCNYTIPSSKIHMGIWVTLKVGHQSLSLNATVTGQSMSNLNALRLTFSSPILLHLPHRLWPWTGLLATVSCYALVLKPQCQKFLVHIGGGRFARQNTICLVKFEVHIQCGHTYAGKRKLRCLSQIQMYLPVCVCIH